MSDQLDGSRQVSDREKFDQARRESTRSFWFQVGEKILLGFILAGAMYLCTHWIEKRKLELEAEKIQAEIKLEASRVENETKVIAFTREKDLLVTYLDVAKQDNLGIWLRCLEVIEAVSEDERTKQFVSAQKKKYDLEYRYAGQVTTLQDNITSLTKQLTQSQRKLDLITKSSNMKIATMDVRELQLRISLNSIERESLAMRINAIRSGSYDSKDYGFESDPRWERGRQEFASKSQPSMLDTLIGGVNSDRERALEAASHNPALWKRSDEIESKIVALEEAVAAHIKQMESRIRDLDSERELLKRDLAIAEYKFSTLKPD